MSTPASTSTYDVVDVDVDGDINVDVNGDGDINGDDYADVEVDVDTNGDARLLDLLPCLFWCRFGIDPGLIRG